MAPLLSLRTCLQNRGFDPSGGIPIPAVMGRASVISIRALCSAPSLSLRTCLQNQGFDPNGGIPAVMRRASVTSIRALCSCKAGVEWKNYPNTQDLFPNTPSLIPHSTCTPESLADVVAIVREAEANQKRVHAFGSKWSFSDCAFTSDYVIDTRQLNQELPQVKPALRPGQDSSLLYHVEAGITIRDLYTKLDRSDLALETMGGSSGQALAGAVSTGTHGGDKDMAPLADSVVAIHLVGAGGTQYWIEPSAGITDPALLRAHVVPDVDPQNIIY